jgi:hypothetical protein
VTWDVLRVGCLDLWDLWCVGRFESGTFSDGMF